MNQNMQYSGGYSPTPMPSPQKQPNSAKKILFIVVGVMGVLSVIMLLFTMLFGGPGPKQQLIKVASTQQEIVRVTKLLEESRSAPANTLNLGIIARTTAQTNLVATLSHLEAEYDSTPKGELLNADVNEAIDTKLTTADQNNTYDAAFPEVMIVLLNNALKATNEALEVNPKEDTKALVTEIQTSTTQLLNYYTEE